MTEPSTRARELRPCPWCGSDAVSPREDGPLHFVHCSHCSATGPTGVSEDHAIAAWNRRAHPEGEVREARYAIYRDGKLVSANVRVDDVVQPVGYSLRLLGEEGGG